MQSNTKQRRQHGKSAATLKRRELKEKQQQQNSGEQPPLSETEEKNLEEMLALTTQFMEIFPEAIHANKSIADWIGAGGSKKEKELRTTAVLLMTIHKMTADAKKKYDEEQRVKTEEMASLLRRTEKLEQKSEKTQVFINTMKEKNEELQYVRACKICFEMSDRFEVVLPCGHVFCSHCVTHLSVCAICRGEISGHNPVFF